MAVETHHLHLFQSQTLRNRYPVPPKSTSISPSNPISTPPHCPQPLPCSSEMDMGLAPLPSGDLFPFDAQTRKRSRTDDMGITAQIQQQMGDVDRLIAHHAERIRAGLSERRRRFALAAMAAAEERAARRLRAKEAEIERIGKINWALEDRIRALAAENQIWRELAEANEAAANVLRANLGQVLAAAAAHVSGGEGEGETAEDAESCCQGDNNNNNGVQQERRVCRRCCEREPTVLLLACRHLCLCSVCGPAVDECPICKCGNNGSVLVNVV